MQRVYAAHVTVTLPRRHPSGRTVWVPAPDFPPMLREFARSPEECAPLVLRVGNILAANKYARADIPGFRVAARGESTGFLCALAEWHRRDKFSFEPVFEWHATWADVPFEAIMSLLRPAEVA